MTPLLDALAALSGALGSLLVWRLHGKVKRVRVTMKESTQLPKDTYLFASVVSYRCVKGTQGKRTPTINNLEGYDYAYGAECPRCSENYTLTTTGRTFVSCDCNECAWSHFHRECPTCKYKFFILGKDVRP